MPNYSLEEMARQTNKGKFNTPSLEEMAERAGINKQPADEGIISNIWKGTKAGVAGVYGGLAGLVGGENAAQQYFDDVARSNQRAREHTGYDLDYLTSGSGLAYDIGQLAGSIASMAPAMYLPGVGAAGAAAARFVPRLLGSGFARSAAGAVGANTARNTAAEWAASKAGQNYIKNLTRYGAGPGTIEAASEAGSGITQAVQEGDPNPYLTGAEIFAKNWPLIVASNIAEGAIVGRGLTRFGGKAGESFKKRAALAVPRAVPYAGAEGLQNSLEEVAQERIQEEAFNKPTGGIMPGTWTENEQRAFHDTIIPSMLLGGLGSVRGSMRAKSNDPTRNESLERAQELLNRQAQSAQNQSIDSEPTAQPAMSVQEAQSRMSAPTISAENSLDGFDNRYVTKWESKPGATDLVGVQQPVKNAFNAAIAEYGDGVTLTGGAEKGYHAAGDAGHEGGWKIDVDKASVKDPQKFLQAMARHGFQVGDEGDHYDLSGHAKGGVGGTVVATPDNFISDNGQSTGKRSGHANAWAIYDVFKGAGYSDDAIAGILGRAQQEHNFSTDMAEEKDVEGIGRVGGYGMFQWQMDPEYGGRGNAFLKWAEDNGLDPQNPTVQAQYALKEAQERGLTPEKMNRLSAEEAADLWTSDWEVGKPGKERQYAAEWRDRIKNGGSAGGSTDISVSNTQVDNSAAERQLAEDNKAWEELAQNGIEAPFKGEEATQKELVQQAKETAIEAGNMDEVQRINNAERSGNTEELAKIAESARKAKAKEAKGKAAPATPQIKMASPNLVAEVNRLRDLGKQQGAPINDTMVDNALQRGHEDELQSLTAILQGVINSHGYEDRVDKGKQILKYADENGIDLKPGLRSGLTKGYPNAIETAQGIIDNAKIAPQVQQSSPIPANVLEETSQVQPTNTTAQLENTQNAVQVESAQNQPVQYQNGVTSGQMTNAYNAAMAPMGGTKEQRGEQGKALITVANGAGIEIPPAMKKALRAGSSVAIPQAQEMINRAGVQLPNVAQGQSAPNFDNVIKEDRLEDAVNVLTNQEMSENPVQLPPRPKFKDDSEEIKAQLNAIVNEHNAQERDTNVDNSGDKSAETKKETSNANGEGNGSTEATTTTPTRSRRDGEDVSSVTNFLDKKIKNPDDADAFVRSASTNDGTISPSQQDSSSTLSIPQEQEKVEMGPSKAETKLQRMRRGREELKAVAKKFEDGEITQSEAYSQAAKIAKEIATVPKEGTPNVTFIDGKIKQELNDYGNRLIDEADEKAEKAEASKSKFKEISDILSRYEKGEKNLIPIEKLMEQVHNLKTLSQEHMKLLDERASKIKKAEEAKKASSGGDKGSSMRKEAQQFKDRTERVLKEYDDSKGDILKRKETAIEKLSNYYDDLSPELKDHPEIQKLYSDAEVHIGYDKGEYTLKAKEEALTEKFSEQVDKFSPNPKSERDIMTAVNDDMTEGNFMGKALAAIKENIDNMLSNSIKKKAFLSNPESHIKLFFVSQPINQFLDGDAGIGGKYSPAAAAKILIERVKNGIIDIDKLFSVDTTKEVVANEQQGESGSPAGRYGDVESRGSSENQREGTGEVSKRDEPEGTGVHGSDGKGHSERLESSGVREGTELAETAGNGDNQSGNQSELPLTEAEAHPSPTEIPGHDYEIKESANDPNKKDAKVRYKQNIEAIRLLKKLTAEDRMATPTEQKVLGNYNGWGGLLSMFDKGSETEKELREILTDEEFESAKSSSISAYYTPPKIIRAIWEGLSHLGFKGGKVLDPAIGVGNFFGSMPRGMMKKSELNGVDMDKLSAEMAAQLYQSAQVWNAPFQRAGMPDNFFDLVITNVPFEQVHVQGYQIHNFYFAEGIDKVRPGGLMVYITSQGSLASGKDAAKMRTYLNNQADLVGAFKLPSGVFDATQVGTDVVVFQKHDLDGKKRSYRQSFTEVTRKGTYGSFYGVNEYFEAHPDNVLGQTSVGRNKFGDTELNVKMANGTTIDDVAGDLEAAIKKLPKGIYKPVDRTNTKPHNPSETAQRVKAEEKTRDYEYYFKDGEVVQNQDGQEVKITDKRKQKVLKGYVKLKNTLNALLAAETDPKADNKTVESLRKNLNKDYDAFVANNGYLNGMAASSYRDDPSAGMVQALEKPIEKTVTKVNKNGQKSSRKQVVDAEKAAIFTERTTKPAKEVTHVETASDALIASFANKGSLNLEYMANLTGKKEGQIVSELKGSIFKNPATGEYETRDEYLSGNVKEKLAVAKVEAKRNKNYEENVKALEKVQPKDLIPDEIFVNLGSPWVPESDVQDFVDSIGNQYANIKVHFNKAIAKWTVDGYGGNAKYNVKRMDFKKFLENVINGKQIRIYRGSGKERTYDEDATKAAVATAEQLQQDFQKWIWSDKARAKRLAEYYNDNYNNSILREYDGSHLNFHQHGMNAKIELKPHQKNVVWRMLQNGNTLIAHCVGAGKTFEMQTAGMEMRRLGVANKPMYILPDNVLLQFAKEFRLLYPNAKLLVLQAKDLPAVPSTTKTVKLADGREKTVTIKEFTKEELDKVYEARAARNRVLSRIRMEDWDGIIISHGIFQRFPVSPETQAAYIQEEIDRLQDAIIEAKGGAENMDNRTKSRMEESIRNLKERLESLDKTDIKDIAIPFEQLGIDQLFVDEADMFKNLTFVTRLDNIKGVVNPKAPKDHMHRSQDMFIKTQWLNRTLGGRGVVFATGTPISNTMTELYTMMRYLDPKGLKEHGVELFDNWLRMFGDIGQDIERTPTGTGYRDVTKVKNFNNRPELLKMFRKFADILTQEEIPDLKLPKLKNGKPTIVTLEADPAVVDYIKNRVPERLANMGKGFKKQKGEDNSLALTNDLRNLSLTDAKIDACVDNIYKKYQESNDVKGTQLVFSDIGIPRAKSDKESDAERVGEIESPEVYRKIIDRLIQKGIPKEEIAFIQDYKTKDKKQAVFELVNEGEVRVLLGSTSSMGAGTNCQKHMVAIHDFDAPWRPRDLEQRHGRGVRQGNENEEIEIFQYVVKDSFDAVIWEKLKNKAHIISQAISSDMTTRSMEDADVITLSAEEAEMAATGNPIIKERLDVGNQLKKYQTALTAFNKKVYDAERVLETSDAKIAEQEKIISKIKKDIAARTDTRGDKFKMVVGNKTFTKRVEAEEALNNILKVFSKTVSTDIGNIGGFRLTAVKEPTDVKLQLVGNRAYVVGTKSVIGIENTMYSAPEKALVAREATLERLKGKAEDAKSVVNEPNPYAEKVEMLTTKYAELDRQVREYFTEQNGKPKEADTTIDSEPEAEKEIKLTDKDKAEKEVKLTPKEKVESELDKKLIEFKQSLEDAVRIGGAFEQNVKALQDSFNRTLRSYEASPAASLIDDYRKRADDYATKARNDYEKKDFIKDHILVGTVPPAGKSTKNVNVDEFKHTKTGKMIPAASLKDHVDKDFRKQATSIAKNHGGKWSQFAKKILFKTELGRDDFVREIEALLSVTKPEGDITAKLSAAWHGSPHEFDTFSLDHIGSGEGAQVHGWGLYFAGNKETSEGYRNRLSPRGEVIKLNGKTVEASYEGILNANNLSEDEIAVIEALLYERDSKALDGIMLDQEAVVNNTIKRMEELDKAGELTKEEKHGLSMLKNGLVKFAKSSGSLYQVEIPNNDVLLDEQKPLREQPKKVQEGIRSTINDIVDQYYDKKVYKDDLVEWTNMIEGGNEKGRLNNNSTKEEIADALYNGLTKTTKPMYYNVYKTLNTIIHNPKKLSKMMNENGIKGITYDGKRDGQCFVIFDDKAIEIINKFSATGEIRRAVEQAKVVANEDLTPQQRKMSEFGKQMGTPVMWIDTNPNLHGFHAPNGTTVLNVRSNMDLSKTFWHESFHWLAGNNESLYNELIDYFKGKSAFSKKQLEAYRKRIGRPGMSDELTIEEMLADSFEEVKDRVKIFKELGAEQPSLAKQFVAWIKRVMDKFAEFFHNPEGKLTTAQRDSFVKAFGRLARDMVDSEGRPLFKVNKEGREITLPNGELVTAGIKMSTGKVNSKQEARSIPSAFFDESKMSHTSADVAYNEALYRYQNAKSDSEKSKAYNELKNLVEQEAKEAGFENAIPEQTVAYKTRTKAAPKKSIKVYKVFTVSEDGSPTALFIGGTEKLPQGVWLDAQAAYHFKAANGKYYVPSTQNPYTKGGKTGVSVEIPSDKVRQELIERGFLKKGSTASKITALAYRPGWHAGTLPFFPQGGMKPPKGMKANYPNIHRYNQVVFECELAADKNYTEEAENQPKARKKDGSLDTRNADLQYMPENGYYYYATNPMTHGHPELGMWAISGSLKINRALSQEECDKILADHKMPAQEWEQGKMNLEDLGYTGQQYDAARKTLAPITYDDDGKVIPLSERFNPDIDDIRFSYSSSDNSDGSLFHRIGNILSGKGNESSEKFRYRRHLTEMLEKALDVKLRYGKMDGQQSRVVYKPDDRVLRSRHAFDWENILPVAGGIAAEKLGIAKPTDEMRNYVADWILTGAPNNISREADIFHKAMRDNPVEAAKLEDLHDAFAEWLNKDYREQMQGTIQWQNKQKSTWKERKEKLYEEFIEELEPINRMVKQVNTNLTEKGSKKLDITANPMVAFRMLRGSYGRAIAALEGRNDAAVDALKHAFPNVDFTGFKTLYQILDSIDAFQNTDKQRDFVTYCTACHIMDMHQHNDDIRQEQQHLKNKIAELGNEDSTKAERAKLEKEIDDLDNEIMPIPAAYSKANCQKYISDGYDKYNGAQQDLVHFSNTTAAILADSGVISEKRFKELLSKWHNYVPLFRVFEENEDVNFGDSMKHIKGSMRDIVNPLESIIRNTALFIKQAETNKAKCLLADVARCDASGWLIEEVDKSDADKTVITFKENGKIKYLQTDPDIVRAVNNMGADGSHFFIKFLHAITRVARACFTMASPEFALRNVARDWGDASLYTKYGMWVNPLDIIRGFMHAVRRDNVYYEWLTQGAAQASALSLDRDYTQSTLDKLGESYWKRLTSRKFADAILEGLQMAGEYSEYGTRIAMYQQVKKSLLKNKPDATKEEINSAMLEAAFESRDLMDFARHGKAGAEYNKITAFANASMQGWDKLYRSLDFREDPKRATQTAAKLVLFGAMPALLLFMMYKDEDWYKEAPEWLKSTHWLFKFGDTIIRVPKATDMGIRFASNAVEIGLDEAYNKNPHKVKDYFRPIWDAAPNLTPTSILPLLEIEANHSYFTDRPIVPQGQEKLPAKLQYGPYTTSFAKWIGEKFDIAPRNVEHFIAGYTGTLGMALPKAIDLVSGEKQQSLSLTEMPLVRGYLYPQFKSPASVEKYYRELEEQTKLKNEYKLTKKRPEGFDPAKLKRLENAQKMLRKIGKQEKSIIDNNKWSIEDKEAMQRKIQQRRIEIAKKALGK